jgi:hypothetical protein
LEIIGSCHWLAIAAGNKLAIATRGDADRSAAAAHQCRVDVLQHDLASDHAPGDVLAARESYITESRTSSAVQACDESDVLVPDLLTWRVRSWSVGTPAIRTSDHGQYPVRDIPKAARVLAALQRDGWTDTRRRGSHRVLVKDDRRRA